MKIATTAPPTGLADWLAARPRTPSARTRLNAILEALAEVEAPAELIDALRLLDELGVDTDTLIATLLYTLDRDGTRVAPGAAVHALIDGQHEAEKVWKLHRARNAGASAEGLRRLLLAIIRDLRVVFILLARALVAMRAAASAPEATRRALAEVTVDIHAPLANRLGIWQVKWELEDLAFRYLQPDTYRRIARLLDERRSDRERYIDGARQALQKVLGDAGLTADIAGRPKHIFSIWKKMQKKSSDFEHLYDIRALRVLVDDVPTCYAALGIVHTLWPPVPGEFDDYIARPKGNDYRSLHTAVIGPEGKTLEVQIRTHDMHAHAELGVAAHWRYKEGGAGDAAFERKVAAMRRLLDAKGDADDDAALLAGINTELTDDRVYLLTPQGKVLDLPRGATVLDFAYHVHTEVGHRCQGAKVNGRIVPLLHQPASGDSVEILTGKTNAPRRDWIVAEHGYLNTQRAREKVRAWFKHAEHDKNVAAGRELIERDLKRVGLAGLDQTELPARFNLKTLDDLYAAVGVGEVTGGQVARALHELTEPKAPPKETQSSDAIRPREGSGRGMTIEGVGNLLTTLARCCQPLPGDAVIGYLTRGRGVSIHRSNCKSLATLVARDPARMIQVEWGRKNEQSYEVGIMVRAYDRKGLLKDVSAVITGCDVPVLAASTKVDNERGLCEMSFILRVANFDQLSHLTARISTLPNVIECKRSGR